MRLSVAHITFALCALGVATADAHITMIKGAPFKATKTIIVNRPGEEYAVSSVVARSSDGSTHEEIPDNRTGAPAFILISDASTLRTILLDVKRKVYSVQNLSDASVSSALTPVTETNRRSQDNHG